MKIAVVGCNHCTAPVHVREKLAFGDGEAADSLRAFTDRYPKAEAVILSTCNRTELYVARPLYEPPRLPEVVEWLATQRQLPPEQIAEHLYHHEQTGAVEHLFRVSSGLDSMVLGESQILGQARQALAVAAGHGAARSLMQGLFTRSFAVAKEVRNETPIGEGRLSIGGVALDFASRVFSRFDDKTVLMIGAGKMGELTLTHLLTTAPQRVWVTNRTPARAEELAARLHAEARPFDQLAELVTCADVVIASTGAREPLLTRAQLEGAPVRRRFRPLLLLDLGIPRNIEPEVGELENFYAYNIDDLQRITDEHWEQRRASVVQGERLVRDRVLEYFHDRSRREVGPIIVSFRERLTDIMRGEWDWAASKLRSTDEADRRIIDQMVHRAVNKVLHTPTHVLNSKAQEGKAQLYADSLKQLFDLPGGD